ncbi:ABC transporter permease [Egibacter rhizosphaerae]|uniref:ABC transporter permease n=1 Tax=Egibacter rhizosphaerae TaxID=1670831 RepID=UPI0013F1441F|nr:proline/glycine betaine ABC transporter permease [Egibacter rhizosphaerae]
MLSDAIAPTAQALPRIPIGEWFADFIRFLTNEFAWLFEGMRAVFAASVGTLESVLLFPHPLVFIAIVTALGWYLRGPGFAVFTLLAFLLIDSMELWIPTMDTLAMILIATIVAIAVAIPVGIWAARRATVSTIVRPILDFMQTLPPFVYLIPAVFLLRVGTPPGLLATLIFAIPPGVRLAELGIRQVDKEVVEAAEAFGASKRQILWRVQVPLAMPTIMQGVNQVIMLALSMVVIAGMIGAGGLGSEVVEGVTRLRLGTGFEGGIAVVILAIFLDRITSFMRDRALAES